MKILLISGSMRADSQTLKIVKTLEAKLQAELSVKETQIVDLHAEPLSFDIEKVWEEGTAENKVITAFQETLESADGYIIATPEWNGMATPAIKNVFLHAGLHMAHKPGLLVTVSASRGGAYPVAELRMSSYKNSRINYIPEQLIVREANEVLSDVVANENIESDIFYHQRASYALSVLVEYTKALAHVRSSGAIDHETFKNGM